MKTEHKIIRLERAMTNGLVSEPELSALTMMLQEYNKYNQLGDTNMRQNYWTMIKSIVHFSPAVKAYMNARVPSSVKQTINDIALEAGDAVMDAYRNIQRNCGFLPIKVTTPYNDEPWMVCRDAADKLESSIRRRLTKAFKSGGWDGERRTAPMFFNQPVLDAPDFKEVFE